MIGACGVHGTAQLEPEIVGHELEEIGGGHATGLSDVTAGNLGEVDDPVVAVDQDARRRVLGEQSGVDRGMACGGGDR